MRRKQATALIDELRKMLATWRAGPPVTSGGDDESVVMVPLWQLEELLQRYQIKPLERCPGEAHSNAFIDHCSLCAPRWGWVGPVEVVS